MIGRFFGWQHVHFKCATLAVGLAAGGLAVSAQTSATSPQTSATVVQNSSPSVSETSSAKPVAGSAPTPRRRRRRYNTQTNQKPSSSDQQTVGPTSQQRTRDAQILAAQKAQSAETARQNSITTANVVKERDAQQAEPRIQDAPGPGSQPLAGDPAIQPAQPSDTSRIQDAPGPAQTLPQAPPPATQPPTPEPTTPAPNDE